MLHAQPVVNKISKVMRERIAACQSNCKRKCEDQRGKDKNLSALEEGFRGIVIVSF